VIPETGSIEVKLNEVRGGVEIRVSDTGRGIPESIQARLFEPFVSQGKENGTGLGLTVVQKIVQDHGGDVAVEKTSAAGTVFRVLLPLASAPGGVSDSREEGKSRTRVARTEPPQPE
jgi:signal transduction histidine kinase